MNPQEFKQALQQHNIEITEKQLRQFHDYYDLLVKTNKVMNLTNITAEPEVYLKHFYDSLTPLFFVPNLLNEQVSLADIGSGAGFPGIPLKIMNPKLHLVIDDSLNKRLKFLQEVIKQLQLRDVDLVHARAEDFGQNKLYREQFDYVTARAVASLPVLLELCLPAVKVGGYFIAMKGDRGSEELKLAANALKVLGGKLENVETFELPEDAGQRDIILIKKVKKTPKKYPRKAGTPAKKTL